jgi:hypothetical protein
LCDDEVEEDFENILKVKSQSRNRSTVTINNEFEGELSSKVSK